MKKPNKKDKKKLDSFLKEYKELSVKHSLDIKAEIQVNENAIIPVLKIVKIGKGK